MFFIIYFFLRILIYTAIPTGFILLGIFIYYKIVIKTDRIREEEYLQRKRYEISVNQQIQREKDERKAKFDSLPREQKLEILTQKYLSMFSYCGVDDRAVFTDNNEDTEEDTSWDEDEYNIGAKINKTQKGYFGFEYNEFFEGFAPNEETEEENMIANGLI